LLRRAMKVIAGEGNPSHDSSGGNTGRDPVPEGDDGGAYRRIPGEEASRSDFGPVEPARAERRLRRGGEGHGGADDRVTDCASVVGRPRRPVPGGDEGSALSTASARNNGQGGGGEGQRPATTASSGSRSRNRSNSGVPGACTGRAPRAPKVTPTSRKPLGRSREISGDPPASETSEGTPIGFREAAEEDGKN
jgi:hypothetical protein